MSRHANQPTRVPWRSRTVQAVLLSTAVAPLGIPLISPTLPVFRDAFFLTDAEASLLVAGYFVVGIVLSPFIGVLTDRIGRKRMLVTGLLTFGILGGGIAFAPSFEVAMALRVLQGTGAAAIFITTVTIVGDTFEDSDRNTVLGVTQATSTVVAAVNGRLARVLSNDRLIALGFACYGIGFLAIWVVPDSLAVAGGLAVVGAGIGLLLPTVDAAVSKRVVAEYRAGAFSLRNSTTFTGRAAGPTAFAGLAAAGIVGYGDLLLGAAAVAFGATLLSLLSNQ